MNEGNTTSGKGWRLFCGDALTELRGLPDASVDACVVDPPYGLGEPPPIADVLRAWLDGAPYVPKSARGGFMGASWDAFVPGPEAWREVYRVMKPGAHICCFAGTRTADLMGIALRLAGFEVRDTIADFSGRLCWMYGQGFPKSTNVSIALDKAAGAEREPAGYYSRPDGQGRRYDEWNPKEGTATYGDYGIDRRKTAPATDLARQWDGWGTALKPAHEPILLVRKPLEKGLGVSGNVAKWGTGALNVAACRVGNAGYSGGGKNQGIGVRATPGLHHERCDGAAGRWPPNVVLSPDGARALDEQSGVSSDTDRVSKHQASLGYGGRGGHTQSRCYAGTGGASRFYPVFDTDPEADDLSDLTPFFYTAKPSASEKNEGCERLPAMNGRPLGISQWEGQTNGSGARMGPSAPQRNTHSTVKPVSLCRWLCRLITPPGGTVLDPFAGSGTTGVSALAERFAFLGIEQSPEFVAICAARLTRAALQERMDI